MSAIDFHCWPANYQMNTNSRFFCFILPLLLLRSRLPRNNNRGCMHQHSFMASHYTKRRAKGAWHFLPVGRKIRKNASVFCSFFFFFLVSNDVSRSTPSLSCNRRESCVEAISSPFERHAASQIARNPASD